MPWPPRWRIISTRWTLPIPSQQPSSINVLRRQVKSTRRSSSTTRTTTSTLMLFTISSVVTSGKASLLIQARSYRWNSNQSTARRTGRIARYEGTIGFRCRFCKNAPLNERAETVGCVSSMPREDLHFQYSLPARSHWVGSILTSLLFHSLIHSSHSYDHTFISFVQAMCLHPKRDQGQVLKDQE